MNGLPGLMEKVAAVTSRVPGWCDVEKAATLASIIIAQRPKLTLEIGIFGGASFLPMAMTIKELNCGAIIGVDPWDNAIAVAAQTENESRKWWTDVNMTTIRDGFFQCLREMQLEEICTIVQKPSRQFDCPAAIGLLHVDGAHNDEAVHDVAKFASRVEVGGTCVMDDENWVGGGPARAAQRLQQMGFRRLYGLGTGAAYQRIR